MIYANFSTSNREALDLFSRIFRGVQQHISINSRFTIVLQWTYHCWYGTFPLWFQAMRPVASVFQNACLICCTNDSDLRSLQCTVCCVMSFGHLVCAAEFLGLSWAVLSCVYSFMELVASSPVSNHNNSTLSLSDSLFFRKILFCF